MNMDMMHNRIDTAAGGYGGGGYTAGIASSAPYDMRVAQAGYPGSLWGRRLASKSDDDKVRGAAGPSGAA